MVMIYAISFRDLVVYQKAKAVSRKIFELSKTFPKRRNIFLNRSDTSIV